MLREQSRRTWSGFLSKVALVRGYFAKTKANRVLEAMSADLNIDSLLDDLDKIISGSDQSNKHVPHPPLQERSNVSNPKAKFIVKSSELSSSARKESSPFRRLERTPESSSSASELNSWSDQTNEFDSEWGVSPSKSSSADRWNTPNKEFTSRSFEETLQPLAISNINVCQPTSSGKNRCIKIVLAGPDLKRGFKQSTFTKISCDCLRCLSCNFFVLCFPQGEWGSSADYMFFRNNVPNESKLAVKLTPNQKSCAYCCQCSWINVTEAVELVPGDTQMPQWICAGHQSDSAKFS